MARRASDPPLPHDISEMSMRAFGLVLLCSWLASLPALARADAEAADLVFVGNSFTKGWTPLEVHGGVPALVAQIARRFGKNVSTTMLAPDGVGWDDHLRGPKLRALFKPSIDWIVLQDHSLAPTSLGHPERFQEHGRKLLELAKERAPNAGIILFETWARRPGDPFYRLDRGGLSSFEVMQTIVRDAYMELARSPQARSAAQTIRVASIGTAFQRCQERYPEIDLYDSDGHHASVEGSYLAALVLYATIFEASPIGAVRDFGWIELKREVAEHLQNIADTVCKE